MLKKPYIQAIPLVLSILLLTLAGCGSPTAASTQPPAQAPLQPTSQQPAAQSPASIMKGNVNVTLSASTQKGDAPSQALLDLAKTVLGRLP